MTDHPPPERSLAAVGDLEDLEEIGRGGFATVYRAHQRRFGRTVAVKVLDPRADPQSIERFERECAAMGMLSSHPNIVTILDAGVTADGRPYLVMEHMPGGSLDDRLDADGALPWEEAVDITIRLAGALHTAHEATVLHRDVKPANVLLSAFGEPCMGDFGLARFGEQAKTTGVVTATILHAPPEVLAGEPASARSDLYSLGSTLFTLLAGSSPFWRPTDESVLALIGRISDEPVPDLEPDGVPRSICTAIRAAMAKGPAARPASVREWGHELRAAQSDAGLTPTEMRITAGESVAAARRAATPTGEAGRTATRGTGTGTTDRAQATVARRDGPGDDGERTVHHASTDETPAPGTPSAGTGGRERRRRWPLLLLTLVVVAAVAAGAALLLGGGEDDPGGTAGSDPGTSGDPADPAAPPDAATAPAEVVDLLNAHRVDEGLTPLEVDRVLAREAQDQAEAAAAANALLRSDLEAVGARHPGRWAILGENVLSGDDVISVHEDAVGSTATRENLDRGDWNAVGVGAALGEDGRTLFVVEYFAQRIAD